MDLCDSRNTSMSCTVEIMEYATACRDIDLPHLIHGKPAAGRPKNLEVIAELEALRQEHNDESR